MKEDDEGIRFHTLLTAGMHRGDRISPEKLRRRLCSLWFLSFLWRQPLGHQGGAGGGVGRGAGGERGCRAGRAEEHSAQGQVGDALVVHGGGSSTRPILGSSGLLRPLFWAMALGMGGQQGGEGAAAGGSAHKGGG
jgi:hypothetical protein